MNYSDKYKGLIFLFALALPLPHALSPKNRTLGLSQVQPLGGTVRRVVPQGDRGWDSSSLPWAEFFWQMPHVTPQALQLLLGQHPLPMLLISQ